MVALARKRAVSQALRRGLWNVWRPLLLARKKIDVQVKERGGASTSLDDGVLSYAAA